MSESIQTISFGGETIRFLVTRTTRRKTVAIAVGYDGVRVLAPVDLDQAHIAQIVWKRGPWVLRKQAGYRELGGAPIVREFISGETFHYLGRPYRLKVAPDSDTVTARIVARGRQLLAMAPADVDSSLRQASVRNALRVWYQERARIHFPDRAKAMATLLGISTPPIHVVDQSKRWGGCDVRGRIRLNWRLVMAPMSLIDYVIAHETCHVLEHNHSRRFWRSLETIMPNYEVRVRQLDRMGLLFTW